MSLLLFSQLMFGNLFVLRTLHRYRSRSLITDGFLAKIGTVALLWIAICGKLLCFSLILSLFAVLACVFLTITTLEWCERRQIDALERRFSLFLDRWVMNIKLGLSPSAAKDLALREENGGLRPLLHAIFNSENVEILSHSHFLSPETAAELKFIAGTSHLALARLQNLRIQRQQTSEFRRKSGQATAQARIQAVTMLILLFAMQILAVHRYGWSRVGDLILLSSVMAAAGVLLFIRLAQKRKWSV